MRDASHSATIVWLGTFVGLIYWLSAWIAPLASPSVGPEGVLLLLGSGPITAPLYTPALLGLYAINAGRPLGAPAMRVAYAAYLLVFAGTLLPADIPHGLSMVACSAITIAIAVQLYGQRHGVGHERQLVRQRVP